MNMLRMVLRGAQIIRDVLRRRWAAWTLASICLAMFIGNVSRQFGEAVGILIIIRVVVHEGGHYIAARLCGVRVLGIFLIPAPVGVTLPERDFRRRSEEAFFIAGGPIASLLLLILCFIAWRWTGYEQLLGAITILATMELADMLPLNPADGGWFLKSIAFSLHWRAGVGFIIVSCFLCAGMGIGEILYPGEHTTNTVFVSCFAICFSLVELLLYTSTKAGGKSAWREIIGKDDPVILTDTMKTPMNRRTALVLLGVYLIYAGILVWIVASLRSNGEVERILRDYFPVF